MNAHIITLALLVSITSVVFPSFASSAGSTPYPPDLVAYWPGDGNFNDVINGNTGRPFGGVSFAPGEKGQAFSFDGTGRIQVADSPSLRLTHSLAFTAWINVSAYPGIHAYLFFRGDDRISLDPYQFFILSNGKIGLNICDADNNQGNVQSSTMVPLHTWTFVAVSLDDSTGNMCVYINGVLEGTSNTTIRPFATLDSSQNPGEGIGNTESANYSVYFTGLIDELKVYDDDAPAAQPPS